MTAALDARALRAQRPEWAAWLDVVDEAIAATRDPAWDAAVPGTYERTRSDAPLLSAKAVVVDAAAVTHLLQRLINTASRGTPQLATLPALLDAEPDVLALFAASLCHDTAAIRNAAAARGADGAALEAVSNLLATPFLQACNRKWAGYASLGWQEGYCSICGAHPAFAELRGIERTRVFRCGRCGGGWHARPLRCPYCGMDDHQQLTSLVPEGDASHAVIEGCRSCLGYVKTFTRLQGCAPGVVMLEDLASVHLDVAALEQGFQRPPGPGYRLDLNLSGHA